MATGATVGTQRHPYALAVAAGLALFAVATALSARPLAWPWLREGAAGLAYAAAIAVFYDLEPPVAQQVSAAIVLSLVGLASGLVIWRRQPASPWVRPLAVGTGLMIGTHIVLAVSAWPDRGPLVASLLIAGAQAAAVGITLRRAEPLYLSPALVCAAWLLFATDALSGNPNWQTVPIGLAILAIVELARWERRVEGQPITSDVLLTLEYGGMAFVVGAALVQTVFDSAVYGLLGVALGLALVTWAAFTRVRRRTQVGAAVILIAVLLMLVVPTVRVIPQLRGALLWGTLAAIGLVLLLVASTLEESRARVQATIRRIDELMVGWE